MAYLLGLDIGTSGVKVLVLRDDGAVMGSVTQEYPLYSPRPGWSEQQPEELWQGTLAGIKKAISKFHVDPQEIKALGLSGQMHSSVFLDKHKHVIRPAILWNDTRTTKQCREIESLVGSELLHEEACNPALEGFTAPKVLWLRENEPENYAKLRHLVLPKDYIRYRLTGDLTMELSDAAGTLFLNVRKAQWSTPILEKLDIPREILPDLIGSAEIGGTITAEISYVTGIPQGTPVVGGGADNACGAIGAGVVAPGRAMISLGTSGVMLAHLNNPVLLDKGTIHMFNSALSQEFYMMGVMLASGLSYRWFKEQLATELSYDELNQEAAISPAGSKSLLFLPYLSGERTPHGDAAARGVFIGLSNNHLRQDMVRAVLEGVAFSFNDSLTLMRQAGWSGSSVRAIGGGAKSLLWQEIIASITGLDVETLNINEGPAMGAAILAGVGVHVFSSVKEVADQVIKTVNTVHPNLTWQKIYQELYPIYQSLYPALSPVFKQLALTIN